MRNLTLSRILIISILLLALSFFQCRDVGMESSDYNSQATRLYLTENYMLSTSPTIGLDKIYHLEGSIDYTAVLACDMVGTQCNFGIVFSAPPEDNVVAEVEIIACRDGNETVLATKSFLVDSRSYTRYLNSMSIEDPDCCCDDILILRITNHARNSGRLSFRVAGDETHDSYIEVPKVEIQE